MSKKKQSAKKDLWDDIPILNQPIEELKKKAEITVDFSALMSKAVNYKIKDRKK